MSETLFDYLPSPVELFNGLEGDRKEEPEIDEPTEDEWEREKWERNEGDYAEGEDM